MLDNQSNPKTQLWNVEANVVTLYRQIRPWIQTILEIAEARLVSAHWVVMLELQDDLHSCIDVFEGWVSARFNSINM